MRFKHLFLVFITSFLVSCTKENKIVSETKAKELYVVHIHGEWCKTCEKVDEIIHSAEEYFKSRDHVEYLVFDESHATTLKDSAKLAEEKGLEDIFEHERHTGEVLYIDKASKKVLTRFYGVTEKGIYIQATEDLLNGAEVASIEAERKLYELSKPPIDEIKEAKLYVVDVHHDMCGGCATTAPVFEEVADKYDRKEYVSFFTFDLTTRETIEETRKLAEELGIEEIYNNQKHTGEVLFIDAQNKQVLDTLVLEEDPDVYHKLIKRLKKLV